MHNLRKMGEKAPYPLKLIYRSLQNPHPAGKRALNWILDLCKFTIWCLEIQRIQLREGFCPSQDQMVPEAPVFDECALVCKLVRSQPPLPSSPLPAPHPPKNGAAC